MKAVITAAGLGTRSGLDGKIRKEMLPVYDIRNGRIVLRPIIDVIISNLLIAGLDEIAVVLDPQDLFTKNYIETNFPEAQILFQIEKRGYGHAVLTAKEFVGKGSFILNAGDG
ncbi:MAG: sugar phosphate nucleotidyltransferase, partial [Thermoplasmatales archaeon]|nr:sugar phosphate nucleotidyltransferase [Thermoplasmatales archaeon]